uniref:7TM_GPCR_Srx domain-containing protein n=1 Tax=Angiostrongylus cantonensis TaxID=6313 RepID=A0A0K0D7P6_ANGCA
LLGREHGELRVQLLSIQLAGWLQHVSVGRRRIGRVDRRPSLASGSATCIVLRTGSVMTSAGVQCGRRHVLLPTSHGVSEKWLDCRPRTPWNCCRQFTISTFVFVVLNSSISYYGPNVMLLICPLVFGNLGGDNTVRLWGIPLRSAIIYRRHLRNKR